MDLFEPDDEWTIMSPGRDGAGNDGILTAGRRAPAGRCWRIDVPWGGVVALEEEDWLPASLDGRIAMYVRVNELSRAS